MYNKHPLVQSTYTVLEWKESLIVIHSVQLVVQEDEYPVPEVESCMVFPQGEHWPWGRTSVHSSSEIRNRVLIASFCLQGWGYYIFQSRLPKPFFSYSYFLLCKKWVIKLLLRPLLPKVDIKSIIICYNFLCYLYIFKISIIIRVWRCRSPFTR